MNSIHRFSLIGIATLATTFVAAGTSLGAAPAGRFAARAGTVTDAKTGLVWQQVAPPSTYTWADAQTYCQSNAAALPGTGWKLPTVKQLQSIVDDRASNPATDTVYFPSTPADYFWSSTVLGGSVAWYVDFAVGGWATTDTSGAYNVRCVR